MERISKAVNQARIKAEFIINVDEPSSSLVGVKGVLCVHCVCEGGGVLCVCLNKPNKSTHTLTHTHAHTRTHTHTHTHTHTRARAQAWAQYAANHMYHNSNLTIVPIFSPNLHEIRGYNRAIHAAKANIVILMQVCVCVCVGGDADCRRPKEGGAHVCGMCVCHTCGQGCWVHGVHAHRYARAHTHTFTHSHSHTYMQPQPRARTHTHTHSHSRTHTQSHTHTHTHTHTHIQKHVAG